MPALLLLSHQLQLSPFERDILLLCAAMELDTRTASSCARAQGEPGRPYPTFALALSLFDDPSWEALSAHRPLRYWRLIDINQPNAMPLTQSALRADERIVAYIKGLNALDDRLSAYPSVAGAEPPGGSATLLSPSQQEAVDQILWRWRRSPRAVAQLVGADFTSKQLVAREAVRALRREMFVIGADALPQPASELEWLVRLWQRESQLLPLALYVEASHDAGGAEAAGFVRLVSRLAQSNCLVLLGIRDPLPRLNAEAFSVDVGKPTLAEQRRVWSEVLPRDPLGSEEDRSSRSPINSRASSI
jgi:hypothetical protein